MSLLARVDQLMAEIAELGVEIADGMPVPEDESHAMMAIHVLSGVVHAHRNGRHTPYCKCGLKRPDSES